LISRLKLFAGLGLLVLGADLAAAQTPSVGSVLAAVTRALAACDSQIVELTFVTTVHERELRDDGSVKKEKSFKIRHFVREDTSREFVEGMWEDGQAVSASRLADEQRKHEKERRKRIEKRREKAEQGDGGDNRSLSMLEPLQGGHRVNYDFPEITADTLDGVECWRIAVTPRSDDGRLVRGALWVEQGSYRAVAEEYTIADLPGPPKECALSLIHAPLLDGCAVPRHIRVRGKGKAFLIISFSFELEMTLDSVQVNPGLPDSLFALPEAN
jgi:hypothetical protein